MKSNANTKQRFTGFFLLATSAFTLAALTARAQLVSYDGMDYTAGGTLAGQNGGTGWGSAWDTGSGPNLSTISGSTLSYTDGSGNALQTAPGSAVMTDTTTTTTDDPQITTSATFGALAAGNAAQTGTLWMSYLWQGLNTTGPTYRQASVMLLQGSSEYLDIGMPNIPPASEGVVSPNLSLWGAGKGNISASISSTAPIQTTTAANNGNTLFVVIEMTIDATTASDTLTLWIDPTLGISPNPSTAALIFSGQDLTGINNIRFQSSAVNATENVGGAEQVDELRLGDTFADVMPIGVVPEPATLSLAALGGTLAFAFAKRRNKNAK